VSPVVHIGKRQKKNCLRWELLYLGGDISNAGLEAIPDSLPPPPSSYEKITCMSPVVHTGDKAEKELPQEGVELLYLVGVTRMLDLRLSLTHCPLPIPHNILWEHQATSPVVHVGDKAEEELPCREEFFICVSTTRVLDLRLSLTHGPLPPPHNIL
jgi:hypothetical protein